MSSSASETIAAIATPPGRGGVGIIRVSGPNTGAIAQQITQRQLPPRQACYGAFFEHKTDVAEILDRGIALYFPGPHSFTGEDVLELQGHGGPIILDCLLREVIRLGARLARPGEFSERAFLNDKLDLAQAEAIADLIDSASEQAARSAVRSLTGEFSRRIDTLLEQLIELRLYVEAAIDFPEEEIDFLADGKIASALNNLLSVVAQVLVSAKQGTLLREGMTVVIAGAPNAGKSSLLNALAGRDTAIVTPIAGTTRDVLREHIQIDGLPLHIIDTAGLRDSPDAIEQEGIRRAWLEIEKADLILLMVDSNNAEQDLTNPAAIWPDSAPLQIGTQPVTIVRNKCDISGLEIGLTPASSGDPCLINLSAKTGAGVDLLRAHLKDSVGYTNAGDGNFSARRRHLDALERTLKFLQAGQQQLQIQQAGELLAEDLRQAQQALGEITGKFTPDDLLGRIFSSFCIGK
jgi:tRNA modification GTPase